MNRACTMAALVEARFDQRLSDKESASVDRHLQACRSCLELESYLQRLAALGRDHGAVPPPSALEHRRRRLRLLREAAAPRSKPRARPRGVLLAAGMVGLVATVMLIAAARDDRSTILRSGLAPASTWASPTPLRAPTPPVSATLVAHEGARYERHREASGERLRLHEGTVDLQVAPLVGEQRFVVATGDAEVEVRGTDFSVRARSDRLRHVVVREGRVELRRGALVLQISAGESWSDQVDANGMGSRAPAAAPTALGSDVAPAPAASDLPQPPPSAAAPRSRDPSSKAFAAALGKLESGDYAGAAAGLRAFAREHPGDARAEDADFLAIVALQHAGRHAAAAIAARRYLARYPGGARRAEAEVIARRAAD